MQIRVLLTAFLLSATPFWWSVCSKQEMHTCHDASPHETSLSCREAPPSAAPSIKTVGTPHPTVVAILDCVESRPPTLPWRHYRASIDQSSARNPYRFLRPVRAPPYGNSIV